MIEVCHESERQSRAILRRTTRIAEAQQNKVWSSFLSWTCHRCLRDLIRFPFCTEGPHLLPLRKQQPQYGKLRVYVPSDFLFWGGRVRELNGVGTKAIVLHRPEDVSESLVRWGRAS